MAKSTSVFDLFGSAPKAIIRGSDPIPLQWGSISVQLSRSLGTLLGEVERPGDFHATGTIDMHPPRIQVEGVGTLSLPLLASQAEALVARAEQAPYGRGTETLVDTGVRRTWQIDGARVLISGKAWAQDLETMVARAKSGLGVNGAVSAELYKLLVYDTGSFFISHRDSEKAPGMFATLVVVPPSEHRGGELLVRHRGREVRLDLRRDEPSEVAFAAFYADCLHEVLPVVSGYRLALIYNLIRTGEDQPLGPPDYDREHQWAVKLLQAWGTPSVGESAEPTLTKLIYPLEHAYTPAEIGFNRLKGADAAAAGLLVGAAREADCDLYLALVSIEESGWAEHTGGGYWGRHDEDDFEVGEVDESRRIVETWRHPDGSHPDLGPLPFELEELSPPGAFDDLEPDELEFQEATGNEGASFDRLYQRAALVVWPRTHRAAVLSQGGLEVSVPFLGELVRQWREAGADPQAPLREEAHVLAERIRIDWPDADWDRRKASADGAAAAYLRHLTALGDLAEIDAFAGGPIVSGAYGQNDNLALVEALASLAPERAHRLIHDIIAGNAQTNPVACADLLARAANQVIERRTGTAENLRPAAEALVRALPGPRATQSPVDAYRYLSESTGSEPTDAMVANLLSGLEHIDPDLARQAFEHLLKHPDRYDIDRVLLPAALTLHAGETTRALPSAQALRGLTLAHLRRRIAEPLEPPEDWRRPAQVTCACANCQELSRFLADPTRPEWAFRAAQRHRDHLEASVRTDRCDLDLVIERRGSPHTLRCTKNQASYLRRVAQREGDLAHLAQLGAQLDGVPET
ncbi:2OG-Fe(II) oxygenase [Thiocapsa roseopersicina]|uniref:2OG-Fe(II) oxygenase n=1 Tax=Thiocapsa roseopersicina TaxID=1058 RepID=UPI001587E9E7|nr:2OG-Fe(II) oxygenase [Thiocapsa roseopersicina]